MAPVRDLDGLFVPSSVCVIGASLEPSKMAARPLTLLVRHGFPGPIAAVNPKTATAPQTILDSWRQQGVDFYASVSELGANNFDVAVVNVAAPLVLDTVREAAAIGIQNFVVITAGFNETTEGTHRADELRALVESHDLTLLGPNCEGYWNVFDQTILTIGSAADRDRIAKGPVAVVTQSGSVGAAIVRNLQNKGIGCSYFISVGNECDLTALDCAEYVISRGDSVTVLLYIEAFRDGRRLGEVARKARAAGVSLHVLRGGTSEEGRRATATHTGKIASDTAVYSNFLRHHGVFPANSISSLIDAGATESVAAPWRASVRGRPGLGVLTISGGASSLIVDRAAEHGVLTPELRAETIAKLQASLPDRCVVQNPLDPVDTLEAGEVFDGVASSFSSTVEALLDDPGIDILLIQYANRGIHLLDRQAAYLGRRAKAIGKPIVLSLLGDTVPDEQFARMAKHGVLVFGDPARAVDAVALLSARLLVGESGTSINKAVPVDFDNEGLQAEDAGDAFDAQMRLLASTGLRVPPFLRTSADQTPPVWKGPFPVVLKVISHQVTHKSELGWVRLDVRDQHDLARHWRELADSAPADSSIVVQEMAASGVEVIVALRNDPDFGPMLALGTGGSLVELLDDVLFLPAPATREDVLRRLRGTRLETLLLGVRGKPAHDIETLAVAVERLSALYAAHLLDLELEFNPVIVHRKGRGASVVDSLVVPGPLNGAVPDQSRRNHGIRIH